MSKPTRAKTTRAQTDRKAVQATVFDPTSDRTFLDLPPGVRPPKGMRYEWKRLRIRGQIDHNNVSVLQQEGWSPVPIDRHPEMSGAKWPGEATPQWVERQSMILCERPEHICQAVEHANRRRTLEITRAKTAELGMGTHKDIPRSGYRGDLPEITRTVESPTGAVLSTESAHIEGGTLPDGTPSDFPAD